MSRRKKFIKYVTFKEFKPGDYEITSKINSIYKSADRSRKQQASISSARVSIRRAHKKLFEILRCNDWKYFITLTFGFDGVGADDLCRSEFSKWEKSMRSKFPSMYYVAVPEYHKKGDLHYHIVVGGVSASDLGLIDSGRVLHKGKAWKSNDFYRRGFTYDESTGEGMPIYNVGAWDNGFSTATEVRCTDAVAHYVGKYLTKCDLDPRFYNKRRFHSSHNVCKPNVCVDRSDSTYCFDSADDLALSAFGAVVSYQKKDFRFRKYDLVDLSKEEIIKLRIAGILPMPTLNLPF